MHLQLGYTLLGLLLPLLALCDSLKTASNLPSPWKYLGCYQDSANSRLLAQINGTGYEANADMTGDNCVGFCQREGYAIAGLEYGSQCFCAHNFTTVPAPKLNQNDCSMSCLGDIQQACGATYVLSVYINKDAGVPGAAARIRSGLGGGLSVAVMALGGFFLF